MATYTVKTPGGAYGVHVERGLVEKAAAFIPSGVSQVFVVSTDDVWRRQGFRLEEGLTGIAFRKILLPGGEANKRLAPLEEAAVEMMAGDADRLSIIVAFGGGIVTDMAGFLAAIFMRGIPVLQIPTTLLAQVDAAVGGKTGVNLLTGKNLIGSFHQPIGVLIDPVVLETLPEREYRAGLYEVLKHGVIASEPLFRLMADRREEVLGKDPAIVAHIIAESVRIKAEVVSTDEREAGLRRILNFGHTFGHALEAETNYVRFLHGEAVGWGMMTATYLAESLRMLEGAEILHAIRSYGPLPLLSGIAADALQTRLTADKKTQHGKVHFVLPVKIGQVEVVAGIAECQVRAAIERALA